MRSLSLFLATIAILSTHAHAFDFASAMQQAAPLVQSVSPQASALMSNPLVKTLTSSLGVTPTQAIGGSAALINDAKANMSPTDFKALTKQVPAAGQFLSAAPAGMLNTGSLSSQFASLGLKPDMVDKFSPMVLDYLQSGATPGMDKILSAAFAQ
jgi:hypothetical protein